MMRSKLHVLAAMLLLAACGAQPLTPAAAKLTSADGVERPFRDVVAAAPWTVFVFVSADCPCLDAHLDRLRALSATYAPRGVQFFAVDSEVGRTKELLAAETHTFALPFPVVLDPGAKLANGVGAEYATYSVLVDRTGRVVYRGGIDSDKRKLHDDTTPFLREALDDVLAGAALPKRVEGKTLGCVLRKW